VVGENGVEVGWRVLGEVVWILVGLVVLGLLISLTSLTVSP
jgi:hypothetical protein